MGLTDNNSLKRKEQNGTLLKSRGLWIELNGISCLLYLHPTPVLLPGKSHRLRTLVGCSPWRRYESDTTERLHFLFSPSCIGEGNGNPLQWSCLENPRDGGAWWAAVYGVAQSRTRLKQLSSSILWVGAKYCARCPQHDYTASSRDFKKYTEFHLY